MKCFWVTGTYFLESGWARIETHLTRAFADVACRSEPLHADVLLALIEMGQTTAGIREYAFRFGRRSLNNPGVAQPPKATQILHTGDRKPRSKLIAEMCPEYPG